MLQWLRRAYERMTTGVVARNGLHRLYLVGRDAIKYSDGRRSVIVETEMLSGPVNRVVYAGLITHWLPPHQDERISTQERSEIVEMVRRLLSARGQGVEIDWKPPVEDEQLAEGGPAVEPVGRQPTPPRRSRHEGG